MKLIIDINEEHYELIKWVCENGMGDILQKKVANGTPIPDNATFGDVIEKITNRKPLEDNKDANSIIISTKLWNSPYQKAR